MLTVERLVLAYGGTAVINGLSERFRPGEMTAITGPSGCGKSTLLYGLGLMLTPRAGRVLLDGARVDCLPDRARSRLRANVYGFVFQDAVLDYSRTVLDNVLEGALYRSDPLPDATARAARLLTDMGVHHRAHARTGFVSGGQAQRIALCRALVGKPRVILADEPTGNLDARSSSVVLSALQSAARAGAVVVLVTHDTEVAKQCHREVRL